MNAGIAGLSADPYRGGPALRPEDPGSGPPNDPQRVVEVPGRQPRPLRERAVPGDGTLPRRAPVRRRTEDPARRLGPRRLASGVAQRLPEPAVALLSGDEPQAELHPVREGEAARPGRAVTRFLLALLAFAAQGAAAAEPSAPATAGAPAASGTTDAIPPDGAARPADGDPPRMAMPLPGCPKALLREMLAEAAEGDGTVSALAIEREALVLCAQREEAVKRVLALEGEVRALLPRPASPVPAAEPRRPARPSYGWFSIVGSGDRLRAGVTDGRRAWFVRPGDVLPGGARIGAVRPSGAVLSGGVVLPYRPPPGGAP